MQQACLPEAGGRCHTFPGRSQEHTTISSFIELGLRAELLRAVAEHGYTEATPIQTQAIPIVLKGGDLLGAAQTGTGKTAGFTLPLLQRLSEAPSAGARGRPPIRALILTPTRELAAQVLESVQTYGAHLPLRATAIFGGVSFGHQHGALKRGVDIVVATPGRLLDHVSQRTLSLGQVEILVLDEADRMLDMGFLPAIKKVLALLPRERQNLLFSATFPVEIRKLAASFMRSPTTVEVARSSAPAELVEQLVHPVSQARKRELLSHLVLTQDWQQVLVFTRTKHGADRLARHLIKDRIQADAIHGRKTQAARTRVLQRFKAGELRVLVATDIAARGLDIEALPHVVNFDLPHVAEDYVHRIGRTGRAGTKGEAVVLLAPEEQPLLLAIERLIKSRIERRVVPGFEPGTAASPSSAPVGMSPAPPIGGSRAPQQARPRRYGVTTSNRGGGSSNAPRGAAQSAGGTWGTRTSSRLPTGA